MKDERKPLLQVKELKKYFDKSTGLFGKNKKILTAVDGISFNIYKGETFGLVGESGCGKSTTGRTIIKLYEPTDGEILYDGVDLTKIPESEMFEYRRKIQMIFQDPYASLNGRMTVTDIIAEGIDTHNIYKGHKNPKLAKQERIYELLESVGLKREHASRYPHEFSGGQRQRIGIARALIVDPELLVADEPISALDVSIQAQVINLLKQLQKRLDLTIMFIAHDLSVVKYFSDRIAVMYYGKMVELASSENLFKHPLHQYTKSLLSAIPLPDPHYEKTRNRFSYDPRSHQYGPDNMPSMVEIEPGHFILASPKEVEDLLPENFIHYQPKDVVAGDFYWQESVAPTSNKKSKNQLRIKQKNI